MYEPVVNADGAYTIENGNILCQHPLKDGFYYVALTVESCEQLGIPIENIVFIEEGQDDTASQGHRRTQTIRVERNSNGNSLSADLFPSKNAFKEKDRDQCEGTSTSCKLLSNAAGSSPSVQKKDSAIVQNKNVAINSEFSKKKWSVVSTRCLIGAYKEKQHLFGTSLKNDAVWEEIVGEISKENHNYSPQQARTRFFNLKKLYVKKKDSFSQTGAAPVHFDYYEEFDELFAKDHNITPVDIVSSLSPTEISIRSPDDSSLSESLDSTSNISASDISSRKRKTKQSEALEVLKQIRIENDTRWEERKVLLNQNLQLRKEELEERKRSREMFQTLMEKLVDKM